MQITVRRVQNGFLVTTQLERTDSEYGDGRNATKQFIAKDKDDVATLVVNAFSVMPAAPKRPRRPGRARPEVEDTEF